MKILFYGTKPYDKIWFEPLAEGYGCQIKFLESNLTEETAKLAAGYDGVCVFVNNVVDRPVIDELEKAKVRVILLRCAGYNNVDIGYTKGKMTVLRVPSYSPEAVAEFTMGLILAVNRHIHRAYNRTREFNMTINGLMGRDLNCKTAGVIGTGKIGAAMIRILKGFQMRILAYDVYQDPSLDVEYVSLDELFEKSDVITLHCPLNEATKYIINKDSIAKMKDGVILANTSRGGLIHTADLIDGLIEKKFSGVGLDVYEEEDEFVYEDKSNDIMEEEAIARLVTFPNVIVTAHQGFFTREAMQAIALETLENAYAWDHGMELHNQVL